MSVPTTDDCLELIDSLAEDELQTTVRTIVFSTEDKSRWVVDIEIAVHDGWKRVATGDGIELWDALYEAYGNFQDYV